MKYDLLHFEEGDEDFVNGKIEEYEESVIPPVPGAEDENTVLKIENGDGEVIPGCIFQVDKRKIAEIDVMWVDEPYRGQGIGTSLLKEAERELKEKGAYIILHGFSIGKRRFLKSAALPFVPQGRTARRDISSTS